MIVRYSMDAKDLYIHTYIYTYIVLRIALQRNNLDRADRPLYFALNLNVLI